MNSTTTGASISQPTPSKTVTYFIAAEEVDWDYLPGGKDNCERGFADAAAAVSQYFGAGGHASIGGRRVRKVRYIEYNDASFQTLKAQEHPHLGILGPVIRVGWRHQSCVQDKASFPYNAPPRCCIC